MKAMPLCKCGCGARVKRRHRQYASLECVPSNVRAIGGQIARARFAFKKRSARFRTEIARVFGTERRVTREQLLELCDAVYRRGFQSGYAARSSRDRRQGARAA